MRKISLRLFSAAVGAVLAVGVLPAAAQAATVTASVAGAAGKAVLIKNGDWRLYATDTASDGHCARWKERQGSGSWKWIGSSSCSGSSEAVGYAYSSYDYKVCVTGTDRCSGVIDI